MKKEAYILPSLNAAVITDNDKLLLFEQDQNGYKLHPLTSYKLSQLSYLNPEYKRVEYLDTEDLSRKLIEEKEKQDALEIAIEIMDINLSYDYKLGMCFHLDEILKKNKSTYDFVINRFLSTVLPSNFKPEEALNIANQNKYERLESLYRDLREKSNLFSILLTLLMLYLNVDDITFDTIKLRFSDEGIFSKFTLALFQRSKSLYDETAKLSSDILNKLRINYDLLAFNNINNKLSESYNIKLMDDKAATPYSNNKSHIITDIRIRAFRAPDDPETCKKYIQGHRKVLSTYGLENITTNAEAWIYNPSIFVIVVESMDRQNLYGGARVQAADGINSLPIEEATGQMDAKIYDVVRHYAQFGTAELSGLWNSKEVAGLGIGSLFPTRCGLVITEQIGLSSIFSLSSPATVRFNKWLGSRILTEVGENGTFYYPKIDVLATACIHEELSTLYNALPRESEKIRFLRNNPQCTLLEKSPFKDMYVDVHYDLKISNADKNEFKISEIKLENFGRAWNEREEFSYWSMIALEDA